MKVVLCTIFVVITLNLLRKMTLDFCANILGAKQHLCWGGLAESCTLHNHCSYNLEPNSKDDSEYAVLCSLLRGSTDFFFWLSLGRRWAIRTLSFKQVSYESGTLHNLCSYNFEPNSKDNSEYAVLCSLLRGSTGFFILALHGKKLGEKNFEF